MRTRRSGRRKKSEDCRRKRSAESLKPGWQMRSKSVLPKNDGVPQKKKGGDGKKKSET